MDKVKLFIKNYLFEMISFLLAFSTSFSVFIFSKLRFSNDDQFIIYRYVQNIVDGNGFVYNQGEKILGSTTPLFTIVAALFKYFFRSISVPDIIAYINIFFISLGAIFLFKISRNFISKKFSIFLVVIYALNLSKVVPEGMESSIFIFTTLAFLYFILEERNYLASMFLGLMILTRPDAGLIAVLAFIFWIIKFGYRQTFKIITVCIVVVLPWLIFATLYFGSFIPQSVIAKMHTHDIVNQSSLQAFKVQLSHLSRIYWGRIYDPNNIFLQVIVNLIPFFVLVLCGMKRFLNKNNWIIFAVPFTYLISFSLSNPVMFPWYLSQIEPFWILLSFLGFVFLFDSIQIKYLRVILSLVILIGPIFFFFNLVYKVDGGSKLGLFEIGNYLRVNVKDGERVGVNNIGIIGYTSNAYIVDFFGLINEESPYFYPVRECADKNIQYIIPPKLITYFKPDYLVLSGITELTKCFKDSKWFKDNYTLVWEDPGFIFKLNK